MGTILVDRKYPTKFNTPRHPTRHTLLRTRMPSVLGRLWRPLDCVALWNPLGGFDLVHTFNKIPFASSIPWMVTFESVIPRTFGPHHEVMKETFKYKLLSPSCRRIIATSQYAIRRTQEALADWSELPRLLQRIEVIHPNVEVHGARKTYSGGLLSLVFIGNHFARKGGIVALRIARAAKRMNLPVELHVISNMTYGEGVYTDCKDRDLYAADLQAMTLENVKYHGRLHNSEVMEIIAQSHFVLLPTLHDTYGFSLLEGMSYGVPSLASATAAIPEFVKHGENGFLLPLPTNEIGDWIHLRERNKSWEDVNSAYEMMTDAAIERILEVLDTPDLWNELSSGSIQHVRRQHDATRIGALLENIYSEAIRDESLDRIGTPASRPSFKTR